MISLIKKIDITIKDSYYSRRTDSMKYFWYKRIWDFVGITVLYNKTFYEQTQMEAQRQSHQDFKRKRKKTKQNTQQTNCNFQLYEAQEW